MSKNAFLLVSGGRRTADGEKHPSLFRTWSSQLSQHSICDGHFERRVVFVSHRPPSAVRRSPL
jgi:hypothetical protein